MAGTTTGTGRPAQDWRVVDEGWGRRAVDFATLSEPGNVREYVALHHDLGVSAGERLLDMACGAGLAVELAAARGAACAGIDASARLVAVARDRTPSADVRVGDMAALPWDDAAFDVVTSFRGIWGTTPEAVAEARRVLVPGGRLGITVWGHLKASPGAWALAPFRLAPEPKVRNQAAMVALGRPGVGEALLAELGFVDVARVEVPFAWEFADPESYARALASTGPAYEAVQAVGEDAFRQAALEVASERVRDGLPLRASIAVVGFLARTPGGPGRAPWGAGPAAARPAAAVRPAAGSGPAPAARPAGAVTADDGPDGHDDGRGFLAPPEATTDVQRTYDEDVTELGYVMNATRVWGHQAALQEGLFGLITQAARDAGLTFRQRGVLVAATAATRGDAYCALAWGSKLAQRAGDDVAAAVIRGDDTGLDESERALAAWARAVAADPNATTAADVATLRRAGFDDARIAAVTAFVGFRMAFSAVNGALGARPDRELGLSAPAGVRSAVTFGRPVAD